MAVVMASGGFGLCGFFLVLVAPISSLIKVIEFARRNEIEAAKTPKT